MSSVMKRAIQITANREAGYPSNVAGRLPEWFGAGLYEITAPLTLFLELNASVAVAAVTTALIGGAYVGFSAADGKPHAFWSELGVAILFATAAALEMLWHRLAPQLGLALHALWDVLHHKWHKFARIPEWYIPLCVVNDRLAAFFLILLRGVWT